MATQYTAGFVQGQKNTAAIMNSIGAAWETWTPTVTQNNAVAVTETVPSRYAQVQKIVFAYVYLTATGTGTAGSSVRVSLPLTARQSLIIVGQGFIYDNSAAFLYAVTAYAPTTTAVEFYWTQASGSSWGGAPNVALAANDQIRIQFMYEAA
jgi:hypothetical protein